MHGIYCIRNGRDGKGYVGSATDTRKRWNHHRTLLRRGAHHSILLQRAWDKHGESAFSFHVLEIVAEKARLVEREQHWLGTLRTFEPDKGYNISPVAGSQLGFRHSEATRQKMRKPKSEAHKSAMRKPKSAEHRAKMVAIITGRKLSPEAREKIASARRGFRHSEEFRQQCRERNIGRTFSEEHRRKIAEAQRLRDPAVEAERRRKIAETLRRFHEGRRRPEG